MTDEEAQPQDIAPHDLPDDAANPEAVARRKTEAGRRDKRLDATLEGILSLPQGREWIWDLLGFCRVYHQSFVQGEPDSTAFNEGRRSVGNKLLADIVRVSPTHYLAMMKEAKGG